MTVTWTASTSDHPARTASRRSMSAVARKAKAEWLALFAADAVVEDPVGPSPFDPEGAGHRGRDAIAAFWDATIATTERLAFTVRDSYAAGDQVANVGTITAHLPDGTRMDTDGVFVYRVDGSGRITSLRAFWELGQALATVRQTEGDIRRPQQRRAGRGRAFGARRPVRGT